MTGNKDISRKDRKALWRNVFVRKKTQERVCARAAGTNGTQNQPRRNEDEDEEIHSKKVVDFRRSFILCVHDYLRHHAVYACIVRGDESDGAVPKAGGEKL